MRLVNPTPPEYSTDFSEMKIRNPTPLSYYSTDDTQKYPFDDFLPYKIENQVTPIKNPHWLAEMETHETQAAFKRAFRVCFAVAFGF